MTLSKKMKPEFKVLIENAGEKNSWTYADVIDTLSKKRSVLQLTMEEVIDITHFTHPDRVPTITEVIDMFDED